MLGPTYPDKTPLCEAHAFQELLPALAHLAGLPRGCAVEAWEEISHEPRLQLDPLRPQKSLAACQLKDGDILMVQQRLPPVRLGC